MTTFTKTTINKLLLLFCIQFYIAFINCNIHRAIPGTSAFSKSTKFRNGIADDNITFDEDEDEGFFDRIYMKANTAWLYSIPAAMLVGSTGIFPLFIFRVESGQSLKEAISPSNLKVLLSFAVGGLLGDVFLHLLPEAWMYVDQHDHSASTIIGLWIIAGLLCFLILEKIFSEEEKIREQEEDEVEANICEKIELTGKVLQNGNTANGNLKQRKTDSKESMKSNGHSNGYTNGQANGHTNGHTNGHINGYTNGNANGHIEKCDSTETDEKYSREHIKVIGYLNLLANCIDNFTHGLAVAGSFIVSTPVGTCTTFAILLHEIPHEIGDFAILLKAGFNRWDAAKGQLLTASGALFGCLFGLMAEGAGDASAWVLPFTSGGFIYIALVTIVPDLLKEDNLKESLKQIIAMVCGISIMGFVSLLH